MVSMKWKQMQWNEIKTRLEQQAEPRAKEAEEKNIVPNTKSLECYVTSWDICQADNWMAISVRYNNVVKT